jgi:hypothetical protein
MPSDRIAVRALAGLDGPCHAFRAALVAAIEELTGLVAEQRAPAQQRAAREAVRLGAFAAGRIDMERFSGIVGAAGELEPHQVELLEKALRILRSFAAQGDDLFMLQLRRGADLRDAVRDALAARGRAFNTAHQAEILRAGRGVHVELEYGTLDFRSWTRRERLLAPPLVVEVNAADLHAAALAEYLDGAQKIVLVVDGRAAPAPLVRLVAPSTFVMQTASVEDVARLGAFPGAGIVALFQDPADVALFTHDPSAGRRLADRLVVTRLPERPRGRVAGISTLVQTEELAWLRELQALAATPAPEPPAAEASVAVSPADRLAAWLLTQAEAVPAE